MRMKNRILVAFLTLAVLASHLQPAQAFLFRHCWWKKRCCNTCTMQFTCQPYNAFTPVCFGNMSCCGCAPFCAPPCGLYSPSCCPEMAPYCCPPACGPCCDGFACAGPVTVPQAPAMQPMPQAPMAAPVAPTFTPPAPMPLNQTQYQAAMGYGVMPAGYYPGYYYPAYAGYYPVTQAYWNPAMYGYGR